MLGPGKKDDAEAERIHKARMQGIRRPRNPNQMISGINPSEMDYANVSSFHSGANIWEGMMTASSLGKQWQNPFVNGRPVDPELEAMAERGDIVHEYWQDKLMAAGVFQSSETPVWGYGMSGVVDAFAKGGIPVEIKTIQSDKRLEGMRRPREKDIGQTNFDINATNAQYGYLLYASREDPLKVKLFRVVPDIMRLSRDIELQKAQMQADTRIDEGHLFNPSDPSVSYLHRKMLGGHAAVWRRGDPFEITKFFSMNIANTMLGINTAPEITGEDPLDGMQEDTVYAGSYNLDLEIPQHRDYTTASNHPLAMSQSANLSKVRDYKTQLQHLPGLPRTFRSRNTRPNMASLTEF
jgi:hypothetical protein